MSFSARISYTHTESDDFWKANRANNSRMECPVSDHETSNLIYIGAFKPTWKLTTSYLVGGWTNPSEKYARQIGNLPQVGVNIKNIWVATT